MKNPCYNTKTNTDCPERAVGCSTDCPKWASYVQERERIYKERQKDSQVKTDIYSMGPGRLKTYRDTAVKKLSRINNN